MLIDLRKNNESGGFISTALLLLLFLFITPLMLLASFSLQEIILSKKMILKKKASNLAEYAFWEWIAKSSMNLPDFTPENEILCSKDRQWTSKTLSGQWENGRYKAWGKFRNDDDNLDGLPETSLVLFDRSFGFLSSPYDTGGYPVIDVRAESTVGIHSSLLDVSVTCNPYLPPEVAVINAGGTVNIIGPAVVDGRSGGGGPSLITTPSAGVNAVAAVGLINTAGNVELLSDAEYNVLKTDLAKRLRSPYSVLDLSPSSLYLDKKVYQNPPSPPWKSTICFKEDYFGKVTGHGTMIVHNPLFDPLRYLASYQNSIGLESEDYDPSYSHLDPVNQPAVLEPSGESLFRGVIIVDDFRPGIGHLKIIGQLFILNPIEVNLGMSEGLTVEYNHRILHEYVHGDCDLFLTWRREIQG